MNWTPESRATEGAEHVDHEMSQLLGLHSEIRSSRYPSYPAVVRSALHVAYAAHFRTLLEFFHGRRPRPEADPKELRNADVRYTDYTSPDVQSPSDPFGGFTEEEVARLSDADKLLAHLSANRNAKRDRPDWGCDGDFLLIACKIHNAFREIRDAEMRFPRTAELLSEIMPYRPATRAGDGRELG